MLLSIFRGSEGGRPRPPWPCAGKIGSIKSHCSSVNSCRRIHAILHDNPASCWAVIMDIGKLAIFQTEPRVCSQFFEDRSWPVIVHPSALSFAAKRHR